MTRRFVRTSRHAASATLYGIPFATAFCFRSATQVPKSIVPESGMTGGVKAAASDEATGGASVACGPPAEAHAASAETARSRIGSRCRDMDVLGKIGRAHV